MKDTDMPINRVVIFLAGMLFGALVLILSVWIFRDSIINEMKREVNLLEGFNAVKVEVICRESGLPIVISESKIIDIFTHVENEAVKFSKRIICS